MLGKAEHIALGIRHGIKPAFATMGDNDDLALPAPVFDGASAAFFAVDFPADRFREPHRRTLCREVLQGLSVPCFSPREPAKRRSLILSGLGFCFPSFREDHSPKAKTEGRKGADWRETLGCNPTRGEASLARFEAQASGQFGSMSRTDLEGIVNVNDGLFVAVIFVRRHHAELAVILKQRHRRHQHLGKIECVVLGEDEIVRHFSRFPFERGPSPLDRRPNVPGLTAITAEASADSGRIVR